MIFATNLQLNCFILFIFFGVILGFIFNLFFVLFLKNNSKLIKNIILNTIFCTFFCVFFVILLNLFNFGKLSLSLILAYLLGYFWVKKLTRNLVDKLSKKWYTLLQRRKKNEKPKPKT